jgi:hypothetical protein
MTAPSRTPASVAATDVADWLAVISGLVEVLATLAKAPAPIPHLGLAVLADALGEIVEAAEACLETDLLKETKGRNENTY